MDNIMQLVKQFRDAIDSAKAAGEFQKDYSFYNFPRGCCGDTCDLLAQFLLEHGIKTYYVWGIYNQQTHAWLLTEGHSIIDITGDQFKDKPEFSNYDKSVYIGAETDFHKLFKIQQGNIRENKGLDGLAGMCRSRLKILYHKIREYISLPNLFYNTL